MNDEELAEEYNRVLNVVAATLRDWEGKAVGLMALSTIVELRRDHIPRNDLLDMRLKMDDIKKLSARCDKIVKESAKWVDNAILLRLQEEELDNYSYMGKLYYPSTTNYPSVADRTALEHYILDSGNIDVLGNTLNREVINNYLDTHSELPPGVNSHNKIRLNCRNKT